MRVLWIAPNGGNYKNGKVTGTGGWIGALQEELTDRYVDLELGIAFSSSESEPLVDKNVTYYPLKIQRGISKLQKAVDFICLTEHKKEEHFCKEIERVIDDFNPDIIHVWGVENTYAAVIPELKKPFVVHIQGLLSLYIYIYMPPAFSLYDIKCADPWWKPITWAKKLLHVTNFDSYKYAEYRAERELKVAKSVKNWIGRTEWDRIASEMLSPKSNYYHCDELMRKDFLQDKWQYHFNGKTVKIHSTISAGWYKGLDIVLKTAEVLKRQSVEIEWNVYGIPRNDNLAIYFINKFGINPEDVGVKLHGHVTGDVIRDSLISSDVFVHPSYIENSSNSIAEAMLMGVPTIAQYVGGNPSMLRDESGILVQPDSPYILADAILKMTNKGTAEKYSSQALMVSSQRQDSQVITSNLYSIYERILEQAK